MPKNKGDYVILLHGMFHSIFYMSRLKKTLIKEGYDVISLHYPIGKYSIEELANTFLKNNIIQFCIDKKKKIHFVSYSLGGILIRKYLADHILLQLGRVVMIAPPNHGSEIADFLKNNYIYNFIFGIPGQTVGKSSPLYTKLLPQKVDFEVGIIAGDRSFNPLSHFLIHGKNDGLISVNSTKLKGMKDHIVIHASHFLMLYKKDTIRQMLYFLKRGKFDR